MAFPKIPFKLNKQVLVVLFFVVLFLALGSAIFFYGKYREEYKKAQQIVGTANAEEVKKIVEKIGKLIELPQGEEPTLATVSDITKLSGQPFFSRAKNGDKVLIYPKIQKAILYRPDTDKIIEVAAINLNQDGPQVNAQAPSPGAASPSPSLSPTPTEAKGIGIILYNGTSTIGLTKNGETILKEKTPEIEVLDRDNASKNDYEKTLVVIISGSNKTLAEKIAKTLNGSVSSLPTGETKPDKGEILVILGKNFK